MIDASSECYVAVVPPREEFLELRGLRHRLLRWGAPSAEPIVLLHGFQDCADTFQFLVDALPRDWSFVGLDWRGFGGSEPTGEPYWFPDYLADLEALLDALDADAAADAAAPAPRAWRLVGHSMGGNIASLYAGIRPARVSQLVSLEGFGLPRSQPGDAPGRYRQWLDQLRKPPRGSNYATVDDLAELLARRDPQLPRAHAAFIARAWTRDAGPPLRLHFDPWHRLVNPVLYRRDETEACWREIAAPVLMVVGEESEYRSRLLEDGTDESFRRHFRHADIARLPRLGHMLHHEDPVAVARVVEPWLRSVR